MTAQAVRTTHPAVSAAPAVQAAASSSRRGMSNAQVARVAGISKQMVGRVVREGA